jgi:putative transposase
MRHRLYYHLIWTTRGRLPLRNAELAAFLGRYLRNIARQERAHVLEMGIVTTHLHLLVRTDPQTDLSRLVQRFKGGSAHQANVERLGQGADGLRWAKGYTLETVSPRDLEAFGSISVDSTSATQQRRFPAGPETRPNTSGPVLSNG